jgi:Xaa-Pro dipeptidase
VRALCARTDEALRHCGYDALLLHAGVPAVAFVDDYHLPFKVHAPFKAWAPLPRAPDSFIYYAVGQQPMLVLHQPADYWEKPPARPDTYWSPHFDVRVSTDRKSARALLPQDLTRTAFVGTAFPELVDFGVGAVNPEHLMHRLDYARAAKSEYEVACLRAASHSGARGHLAAARAFAAGATEFEIELAFLAACGLREQELPYNPIIALNEGGAVLHYQLLERAKPAAHHSLLIDAGTEFAGYASDITRTYSYRDAEFAALVGRFDRLQQELCAKVRAGLDWRDFQDAAFVAIAQFLREADVIKCSSAEAIDTGIVAVFYPHGIGHLLGLQVHDVGGTQGSAEGAQIARPARHPFLRLTRKLEAGFVVTVEPGVYFIEQLLAQARADSRAAQINWSRVEALKKFGGIRIEDNVVALAGGNENMTRAAFASAA